MILSSAGFVVVVVVLLVSVSLDPCEVRFGLIEMWPQVNRFAVSSNGILCLPHGLKNGSYIVVCIGVVTLAAHGILVCDYGLVEAACILVAHAKVIVCDGVLRRDVNGCAITFDRLVY